MGLQASQQLHAHRHAVRCNSSAEGTSYFSTPPCSGGLSLGSSASTHCIVASAPESSLLTCRVASGVPLTDVGGSGGDGGGNGVGGDGNNGNGGNWEGGANEGDDEDSTLLNQQEVVFLRLRHHIYTIHPTIHAVDDPEMIDFCPLVSFLSAEHQRDDFCNK